MRKVISIILVITTFLSLGLYLGIGYVQRKIDKSLLEMGNLKTSIAVVNLDEGYQKDGETLYHSNTFIDLLSNDYFIESMQGAQSGINNGRYGAVIIFPTNTSANVESLNNSNPTPLNIEYSINPNLSEADYVEVQNKIASFKDTINDSLSYIYVMSILEAFQTAQDNVTALNLNNESILSAIDDVSLGNFTESLNLSTIPEIPFNTTTADFAGYATTAANYANNVSNVYIKSYQQALADYQTMRANSDASYAEFTTASNGWLNDMNTWSNDISVYNSGLLGYTNDVMAYKTEVDSYNESLKLWSDYIDYQRELVESYADGFSQYKDYYQEATEDNINRINNFNNDVANKECYLADDIDEVYNSIASLNVDYEAANDYITALTEYVSDVKEWETTAGICYSAYITFLPDNNALVNTYSTYAILKADKDYFNHYYAEHVLKNNFNCWDYTMPDGFWNRWYNSYYGSADNLNSKYDDALKKLEEACSRFAIFNQPDNFVGMPTMPDDVTPVTIEAVPDFPDLEDLKVIAPELDNLLNYGAWKEYNENQGNNGNNSSIINPEDAYTVKTQPIAPAFDKTAPEIVSYVVPVIPDTVGTSYANLAAYQISYNPYAYLDEKTVTSADAYLQNFKAYNDSVETSLASVQNANIASLNSNLSSYKTYLSTLKTEAVQGYNNQSDQLATAITDFQEAVSGINSDNAELLGNFASLLLNTRSGDDVNTNVVDSIVCPIVFTNSSQIVTSKTLSFADVVGNLMIVTIISAALLGVMVIINIVYFVNKKKVRG